MIVFDWNLIFERLLDLQLFAIKTLTKIIKSDYLRIDFNHNFILEFVIDYNDFFDNFDNLVDKSIVVVKIDYNKHLIN